MNKPKLVFFCGLPGSGKTTLAKKLETEYKAIRLNTDEWMADLGFDPNEEEMHLKMQNRLWDLAKEILQTGSDVILENGLWTKKERDDKRREAGELNVETEIHYLDVSLDELKKRLHNRNATNEHGYAQVSETDLDNFSKIFEAPTEDELKLFDKVIVH